MKTILITYSTFSGTTLELAEVAAEHLVNEDRKVEVKPISQAANLNGYDLVILGAPMIMGFHRPARAFLKEYGNLISAPPLAIFITAMNLISDEVNEFGGVPLFVDKNLAHPPEKAGRLTLKERYASIENYVRPILRLLGQKKPVSIALFGGRLNFYRMKLWAVLFVMLLIQSKPSDLRNKEAVRAWVDDLVLELK